MPFRPPISLEELHEMFLRQQASDVTPLLWEIKRLHAIVLRAYQLQASMGVEHNGGTGLILGALRRELTGEPIIAMQADLQRVAEDRFNAIKGKPR